LNQYQQSEATSARRWIPFQCFDDDSADAYAPKTGLTFSDGELKIAKAGAAVASATGYASVVEAGNGWYWYPASASELDTLGPGLLIPVKRTCTRARRSSWSLPMTRSTLPARA